jgi:hypothetical protein
MSFKHAPIPPAAAQTFTAGIGHPTLWLWDSWTLQEPSGLWHLYCLALSKVGADGRAITPPERNDFTFHVRHFESADQGHSWQDCGAVLESGRMPDGADARNVWSGSVLRLSGGQVAFGFTGLRDHGPDRRFLQTICGAIGKNPGAVPAAPAAAISCPHRDYDDIVSKGYYLGPHETLGSHLGEAGGPIMAWRDPFLFETQDGELHAVWSAKISPTIPAIARARLKRDGAQIVLAELCAPITLPDAALMTQAEVPKIYYDPVSADYVLLVSACDRRYEGQADSELTHMHRLYRSQHIEGPWQTFTPGDSAVPGLQGLFGASLLDHDISAGQFTFIAPYTENAGPEKQLRFAGIIDVQLAISAPAASARTA